MKYFLILVSVLIISCSNSTQEKTSTELKEQTEKLDPASPDRNLNDTTWRESFLELQTTIMTGNKTGVKAFIDFPIENKDNEIWYLADSELVMEMDPNKIKPFTEADFDKYFNSIFSLDLRKTLEKINVEEFFKTHKTTSPKIEVVQDTKSQLEVNFDETTRKINLNLLTSLNGETGFTIVYEFEVRTGNKIRFREVRVEG